MSHHRLGAAVAAALCAAGLALASGCAPADPLERARTLQAAGDFAGSLEPLRARLQTSPEDAEAHFLYGLALARSGQPSASVWSLRKAMEDPKWRVPAAIQLASGAMRTGNPEEAIDVTGRVLEQEPDNVEALVLRAEAKAVSRRDYEGALADAERALELDPDQQSAQVTRAVSLLALARVDEAEKALNELEQQASEADFGAQAAARFCLVRASFLREKGEPDAAFAQLDKCLRDFPASGPVIGEAVRWYDASKTPERSIEILREALRTEPLATWHRVALAERLTSAGKPDEAEKVLREGTEVADAASQAISWVDLAGHFVARERLDDAVAALEQAIELSPDPRPELLFQYAETLLDAGQPARAREVGAKLALPAYRELIEARVLLAENRPAEALAHFDEGLRHWPANAVARYYAARAAEAVGDFDRAIDEYRYSIRADSTLSDARYRLARLHEAEHKYDFALTIARHWGRADQPDLDAERVALRILGRLGRLGEAREMVARHGADPERWPAAVAAMAEGTRARVGAAETAQFLRRTEHLDLKDPRSAPALRQLVLALLDSGDAAGARAAVDAALAAHPDAPELHALRGVALSGKGGDPAAARAAFERAVALDAADVAALAGLARLAADAGDSGAAIDFYGRAIRADRTELGDPEPRRALAELLIAQGKRDEGEAQLRELLAQDPYDGRAAARLAALQLERDGGGDVDAALALAQRAARFGGAPESYELLARIYRAKGDAPRADEATRHAEQARARALHPAHAPAS
jgi:tetratricopeptide (TPR) repeat protein